MTCPLPFKNEASLKSDDDNDDDDGTLIYCVNLPFKKVSSDDEEDVDDDVVVAMTGTIPHS